MTIKNTRTYAQKMRTVIATLSSGALLTAGLTFAGAEIATATISHNVAPEVVLRAAATTPADSDGDGVPDPESPFMGAQPGEDRCSNTPAGEAVDAEGCTMAQRYFPSYVVTEAVKGRAATSAAPTFDDATTTAKETLAANELIQNKGKADEATVSATFASKKADSVAANGAVTWTPNKTGEREIPVDVSFPDGTAAVGVFASFNTAKAPDTDGDSVPDAADPENIKDGEDKCSDTPDKATVDTEGCTYAQRYKVNYEETKAPVGKEATSKAPTFDDETTPEKETLPYNKLGKNADRDATTVTFEIIKGGSAEIDAATIAADGSVTLALTAKKDTAVPVTVKYPDESTEGAEALFKAVDGEAPGNDGDPKVVDADKDGVVDADDKCLDTAAGAKVDKNGCSQEQLRPDVDSPEGPDVDKAGPGGKTGPGGKAGKTGTTGKTGKTGKAGKTGTSGKAGKTGKISTTGKTGTSGLAHTGLNLTVLSMIALTATAGGAGVVAMRRRREN